MQREEVPVIGRSLPGGQSEAVLRSIALVARRYEPGEGNKAAEVRSRFREGISLTGREGRVLFGLVASEMSLPLPFQTGASGMSDVVGRCQISTCLHFALWHQSRVFSFFSSSLALFNA